MNEILDDDARGATRRAAHPLTLDPHNMLGAVRELPSQLDAGWARARRLVLPASHHAPRAVLVAGMGGSAIAGDLVGAVAARGLRVPYAVLRDYALPAWVDAGTLFVASSFSGDTEETLAAWAEAGARGARRVAITTGGRLLEAARRDGAPLVPLPGGGQPRAALGHSLTRVLGVLWAAGLVDDPAQALGTASTLMRALVASAGEGADPAVSPSALAGRLEGRIPLVWASEEMAPVARRWRTQFNENAKSMAVHDTLPELDHNAVEGFAAPEGLGRRVHVVVLRGATTDPRTGRRMDVTTRLLDEAGVPHTTVTAPGGGRLAEALWHVQFGDLASVYLAYRYGVDPTAIPAIQRLKSRLAEPESAP